jgi:hypothetical protein
MYAWIVLVLSQIAREIRLNTTAVCDNFDWRDLRGLGKLLA